MSKSSISFMWLSRFAKRVFSPHLVWKCLLEVSNLISKDEHPTASLNTNSILRKQDVSQPLYMSLQLNLHLCSNAAVPWIYWDHCMCTDQFVHKHPLPATAPIYICICSVSAQMQQSNLSCPFFYQDQTEALSVWLGCILADVLWH